MKLVPYTVMVPEHHAELMKTMGKLLTDFEEVWAMSYVEQVLQDHDDPNVPFGHAIELATGNYTFDTEEERTEAERATLEACKKCFDAEQLMLQEFAT